MTVCFRFRHDRGNGADGVLSGMLKNTLRVCKGSSGMSSLASRKRVDLGSVYMSVHCALLVADADIDYSASYKVVHIVMLESLAAGRGFNVTRCYNSTSTAQKTRNSRRR